MKVSRSTAYALLAIGYIAKNQGDGVVLSEHIAKQYGIPLEYLLKILQQLVRAKPTDKITMLEIIEAVAGPFTGELNLAKQTKNNKYGAQVQQTYNRAISRTRDVLLKTRLSTLLGGE